MAIVRNGIRLFFLSLFLVLILNGNMGLWLGIFAVSLVSALGFGRFYCGYICPMNTVMRATVKISKKPNRKPKKVPKFLQSKALSWIVLAIMLFTAILSKRLLHQEIPILLILMLLAVFVTLRYEEWVFHNHICPYGALLSLTGKRPKYTTKVEPSQCIGCKECEKVCPSQAIKVETESQKASIKSAICHQCQACSLVCPKDAIHYGSAKSL